MTDPPEDSQADVVLTLPELVAQGPPALAAAAQRVLDDEGDTVVAGFSA